MPGSTTQQRSELLLDEVRPDEHHAGRAPGQLFQLLVEVSAVVSIQAMSRLVYKC
jgi:hypothetical protein